MLFPPEVAEESTSSQSAAEINITFLFEFPPSFDWLKSDAKLGDTIPKNALKFDFVESFSIPKGSRRSPLENEDTYATFRLHQTLFATVFDGHGGSSVSRWLRQNVSKTFLDITSSLSQDELSTNMDATSVEFYAPAGLKQLFPAGVLRRELSELVFPDTLTFALTLTLVLLHERLLAIEGVDSVTQGACASIIAVDLRRGFMHAAYCGDTGVGVFNRGPPPVLRFRSSDHHPSRPDENERVLKEGGRVFRGRAVGVEFSSLGVTRAIGDSIWQVGDGWLRDRSKAKNGDFLIDNDMIEFARGRGCTGVSNIPEFFTLEFSPSEETQNEEFLNPFPLTNPPIKAAVSLPEKFSVIVASDGWWDGVGFYLKGRDAKNSIPAAPADDATAVIMHLSYTS